MGLKSVDSIFAQLVDDLKIPGEGTWMLVVFRGDVGFDCVGELDGVRTAKRYLEDVAALHPDRRRD